MDPDKKQPMRNRALHVLIVVFLLTVSLSLHLIGITLAWRGPLDSIGSWHSHCADSLLKYGVVPTKLSYVYSAGDVPADDLKLRLTHPMFIVSWLTPFRAALGSGEWSSRLGAVFLSMTLVVFIYLISRLVLDEKKSLLALAFASLLPMEAYWGRLPTEQLAAVTLMTISAFFYLSFVLKSKKRYAALFLLFHFLSITADWIAYFLPVSLIIFETIAGRKKYAVPLTSFFLNFVYFGLFILHGYLVGGYNTIQLLFSKSLNRSIMGVNDPGADPFSIPLKIGLYFTIPLCIAGLVWLYRVIRQRRDVDSKDASPATIAMYLPLLFLFIAAFWILSFMNYVSIHDVALHILSPFFVLAAAVLLSRIKERRRLRLWASLIIVFMALQLTFVLSLRYSEQKGYPVDYPVAVSMESVTGYHDHIITHINLIHYYYQFYCDRDLKTGINDIDQFRSLISRGDYTKYVALDLGSFSAATPDIRDNLEEFTAQNQLKIDPSLLDYLTEHYPSERRSFFLVFDLTRETIN